MELTLVYLVTFFFPDVCLLDSINGILSGLKWTFHSTGFWEILDQVKKSDGSDDRERQILQILFVILETWISYASTAPNFLERDIAW